MKRVCGPVWVCVKWDCHKGRMPCSKTQVSHVVGVWVLIVVIFIDDVTDYIREGNTHSLIGGRKTKLVYCLRIV